METDTDFIQAATAFIEREICRPEILFPVLNNFFKYLVPYLLLFILVNFFFTIGAVSLVLYFRK